MRSTLKAAALAALTCLVLAVPAMAQVREGSATDPARDTRGGVAADDILSARVHYDSNGDVTVVATMNGDIAAAPEVSYSFVFGDPGSDPNSCMGDSVATIGGPSGASTDVGYTWVHGYNDQGVAQRNVSGNTLTFTVSDPRFANLSWSCVALYVANSNSGMTYDYTWIWPDGSRQAANQKSSAAGEKCVVPKLKGKTLAAAKKALTTANCKLGAVTKQRSKGNVTKGDVVSQKLSPGTSKPAGTSVAVVLQK
jgi:hypothetical protein